MVVLKDATGSIFATGCTLQQAVERAVERQRVISDTWHIQASVVGRVVTLTVHGRYVYLKVEKQP